MTLEEELKLEEEQQLKKQTTLEYSKEVKDQKTMLNNIKVMTDRYNKIIESMEGFELYLNDTNLKKITNFFNDIQAIETKLINYKTMPDAIKKDINEALETLESMKVNLTKILNENKEYLNLFKDDVNKTIETNNKEIEKNQSLLNNMINNTKSNLKIISVLGVLLSVIFISGYGYYINTTKQELSNTKQELNTQITESSDVINKINNKQQELTKTISKMDINNYVSKEEYEALKLKQEQQLKKQEEYQEEVLKRLTNMNNLKNIVNNNTETTNNTIKTQENNKTIETINEVKTIEYKPLNDVNNDNKIEVNNNIKYIEETKEKTQEELIKEELKEGEKIVEMNLDFSDSRSYYTCKVIDNNLCKKYSKQEGYEYYKYGNKIYSNDPRYRLIQN